MKTCTKCGLKKELFKFHKDKNRKDGLSLWCKDCVKEYTTNYYNKNKKQILNLVKLYRKQNKEKIKLTNHNNYLKNKKEILQKCKKYRENHKKQKRDYNKIHQARDSIQHAKYLQEKYNTDINYKLICLLRTRLNLCLKRNTKSGSAIERLGCSIDFLKQHLEVQFTEGMNWDNQGINGWHIDHIRPLASFDLSKKSEQFKACHYSNLQPLWWYDNLVKSDNF
jgi:hypothetical protein